MTTEVGEIFLLYHTTKEIEKTAREMYSSIENTFELFEIETRLYDLKQGGLSVTQYFNALKHCSISSQNNKASKGCPWCDHCKRPGHMKATCWKLHGKPKN
ncbi:Double-stranded RNA-binding protein 4 [Gossypium australe]|uniref:Double-stranded RNA-binding protein 4 n=1 Tax=Gossypium australe TaxID=47621 RepID=A0A5B6W8G0_9ROSI|nr:Double-stranded RNA-binding protein 4 [Gossypium australe]